MRSPSLRTAALRDRILAALDEGHMLTTNEVCKRVCTTCQERGNGGHCYSDVYASLRSLARLELVHWTPTNGMSQTTWMLTTQTREGLVGKLDLEALWRAPAQDNR